jgi:hypothetical protein
MTNLLDEIKARCNEVGECWEKITKAKTNHRRKHPLIGLGGKPVLARRVAYEQAKGPIKPGYKLVPHCGNEECINPEHQKQVTGKQSSRIGGVNGRGSATRSAKLAAARRGTPGLSKITMEIAREIRDSEEKLSVLGARHGIDPSRVAQIQRGEGWKDYSTPWAGLGSRT